MTHYKDFDSTPNKIRKTFDDLKKTENEINNIETEFSFELDKNNIKENESQFIKNPEIIFDSDWFSVPYSPPNFEVTSESTAENFGVLVNFSHSQIVEISKDLIPFLQVQVFVRGIPSIRFFGAITHDFFNIARYNIDKLNFNNGNPFEPSKENNFKVVSTSTTKILFKKELTNDKWIIDMNGDILFNIVGELEPTVIQIFDFFDGLGNPVFEDLDVFRVPATDLEVKIVASMVNPLYWDEDIKYKET